MQIRLAYVDHTITACRACYGHPHVETLTGAHGPVEDARGESVCAHCEERVAYELRAPEGDAA